MMTYNYNYGKPVPEKHKYFNYQTLYFIFLLLAAIFVLSEVFLFDYSIFKALDSNKLNDIATTSRFDYDNIYVYPNLIGRLCIPLGAFLLFLSVRKDGFVSLKNFALYTVFSEIIYDLYTIGKFFDARFQSPVIVLFFGALYTYLWVEKGSTIFRLFLTIAYLTMSVLLRADYGLIVALLFVVFNFYDPVRKNQAIFGGIISAFGISMFVSMLFVYEYDENYNRKRYNTYLNYFILLLAVILWRLRIILFN